MSLGCGVRLNEGKNQLKPRRLQNCTYSGTKAANIEDKVTWVGFCRKKKFFFARGRSNNCLETKIGN